MLRAAFGTGLGGQSQGGQTLIRIERRAEVCPASKPESVTEALRLHDGEHLAELFRTRKSPSEPARSLQLEFPDQSPGLTECH